MAASKLTFIEIGYSIFAHEGPHAIKIEQLAQMAGVSKSSFYHHFADMEVFIEHLLQKHLQQSEILAEKETKVESIIPELVALLVAHKTDLLFNRQLRINRNHQRFNEVLEKSNAIVGYGFVQVWVKELSLTLTPQQLQGIFSLALENFYLQLHPGHVNSQWLEAYFNSLKDILRAFNPA